jgi:DNA/RNA-binding domain of Phe-tRNA-synthetase-like protein
MRKQTKLCEFNSNDLHNNIKKLRSEREKQLNKRRQIRLKVERSIKELRLIEQQLDSSEQQLRSAEQAYQTALMKEAQLDEVN